MLIIFIEQFITIYWWNAIWKKVIKSENEKMEIYLELREF